MYIALGMLYVVILGCYMMLYGFVSGQFVPLVVPCLAAAVKLSKHAHLTLSSPNLVVYRGQWFYVCWRLKVCVESLSTALKGHPLTLTHAQVFIVGVIVLWLLLLFFSFLFFHCCNDI